MKTVAIKAKTQIDSMDVSDEVVFNDNFNESMDGRSIDHLKLPEIEDFLATGKFEKSLHWHNHPLMAHGDAVFLYRDNSFYGLWEDVHQFEGFLSTQQEIEEVITPSAILLPNKTLLINADDERDGHHWGDPDDVEESEFPKISLISLAKDLKRPVVSLRCVAQMFRKENHEIVDMFNAGRIVVLDSDPETRIKCSASDQKKINEGKSVRPPQFGYSLISIHTSMAGRNKRLFDEYEWHKSGNVLLADKKGKSYLFGQDEDSYFGVELARPCKTILQALKSLMPKVLHDRTDVTRQGEWYMIPVKESQVPKLTECVLMVDAHPKEGEMPYLPILDVVDNKHRLHGNIRVSNKGQLFVLRPKLLHPDHKTIEGDCWCTFMRNTAVRSVSAKGVD